MTKRLIGEISLISVLLNIRLTGENSSQFTSNFLASEEVSNSIIKRNQMENQSFE